MITLGDEDAFREWLRKTCQMKRQDHFENCYEHLQSLLKDPVIRKMVQDRKGRRVFPQSTTSAKETQRLVLQNIFHNPNSYFDLQEISGIEPMCACRLRASGQVKLRIGYPMPKIFIYSATAPLITQYQLYSIELSKFNLYCHTH